MSEVRARQLAIETRLKVGLQSTDYLDVPRTLKSLRISCVKRPVGEWISGATLKTKRVNLILVNSEKSLGHQNFTAAHEIYHCLYDENLTSRVCKIEAFGKGPGSERDADVFAKYLLMPEDAVLNQLRLQGRSESRVSLIDVIDLEQYFGVSRRAMLWRLQELRLLTSADCSAYSERVIQGARRLGRDTELYRATNESKLISDYAEKAQEALERGLITESRYQELLADAGLLETITSTGEEEPAIA